MHRVFIIHPGALGDFILSLPAVKGLSEAGFEVHTAVRSPSLDLVSIFPFIKSSVDLEFLPSLKGSFEFVVAFGTSWEPSLLANLKGQVLFGPSVRRGERWKVTEYAESLRRIADFEIPPSLEPNISWKRGDYVVIHPGSGSKRKNWHLEGFISVARYLKEKGFKVLFLLGPAEKNLLEALKDSNLYVLSDIPIVEVAKLLSRAAFYIGNDSGITHLSAALGTPTIAIFKTTNPDIWRPFGPRVYTVDFTLRESPFSARETLPG